MVFDVANKEFGIAQPKPNPTVSAVVWFDGASAKNPPCYAGATSPRAHVCDTAIGLAATKGFRILRNLYANQPSPGRDQASVTTTPPSNADRAASSTRVVWPSG